MDSRRKHIIIAKLFEYGGSTSHLKSLIKYFGKDNIVLVLEDDSQLPYLRNIEGAAGIRVVIKPNLYPYAHLEYRFTTNIKEMFHILKSILTVQVLSIRFGFADITINAIEPEKHLYLLWIPLSRVIYILHSAPDKKFTRFTSYTCNSLLGRQKKIVTVSNANKKLLCENWDISNSRVSFVHVVYNCVTDDDANANKEPWKRNVAYIVTIGQTIGHKNPMLWLEVAKKVTAARKNVQFLWLGDGPLLDELKVATQGNERISFPGFVPTPKTYLDKAVIYYQPSVNETHGIAVIEAMYNYLPCVVSNAGGLAESVQQGYNGFLVDPACADEHAAALIKLLDDPALQRKYGINGNKRYNQLFNFKAFTVKMDVVYKH